MKVRSVKNAIYSICISPAGKLERKSPRWLANYHEEENSFVETLL